MILKENEVLLRAGKSLNINTETLPSENQNRAFLQLTNFSTERRPGEIDSLTRLQVIDQFVKKMVIWEITNLENQFDVFNGSVSIHNVLPSDKTKITNFNYDTITKLSIGNDYGLALDTLTISGKSFNETVYLINKFIEGTFKSDIVITGYSFNQQNFQKPFPFIVTPSKTTFDKYIRISTNNLTNDAVEVLNYLRFKNAIKIVQGGTSNGFFLVFGKNGNIPIIGPQLTSINETVQPSTYVDRPISYGVLGAQKIYLLSQDTANPTGRKISLKDTIYGIPQEKFIGFNQSSIESLTYSSVRGEEIIKVLQKIVAFLEGHVHPFHGMKPNPVSLKEGQTIEEIRQILNNASNIILNGNIRIN